MNPLIYTLHGQAVLEYPADGAPLDNEREVMDIVGEAMSHSASWVVIPTSRFSAEFFRLRTRVAGDLLQKFVNYRLRLAIVGDLSAALDESPSLRAFVTESNRGGSLWFLSSKEELAQRLQQSAAV